MVAEAGQGGDGFGEAGEPALAEAFHARRTWLRGLDKINQRDAFQALAKNLGTVMRQFFGLGTPRSLQGIDVKALLAEWFALCGAWASREAILKFAAHLGSHFVVPSHRAPPFRASPPNFAAV